MVFIVSFGIYNNIIMSSIVFYQKLTIIIGHNLSRYLIIKTNIIILSLKTSKCLNHFNIKKCISIKYIIKSIAILISIINDVSTASVFVNYFHVHLHVI